MILYAIKHIQTGNLMPARMFKHAGSGWSWWEPTETRPGYKPHDPNPRLFFTRASAANALGQWLRGPLNRQEVKLAGGPMEMDEYRTEVGTTDSEHPPRRREDMVLVSFMLMRA